ncbi:hypothetical protein ACYSNR_05400 [Enterococcus sp. LJL128]
MMKSVFILGVIILLVLLFAAPGITLGLIGLIGIIIFGVRFAYFRSKNHAKKAKKSAIIAGIAAISFTVGLILTPSTETATKQSEIKNETKSEQVTKKKTKQTTDKSEIRQLTLILDEATESDSNGTVLIKGKTEPHATVYPSSKISTKKQADADGFFELTYELSDDSETELSIVSELDTQTTSKKIVLKPSAAFVAVKQAEKEEQRLAEELKLAEEQRKSEIAQLTADAEVAVKNAENNQNREHYDKAIAAVSSIPDGNEELSNRLAAVETAIHAQEEQESLAAAEEAQQAAVVQEQQQVAAEQTVLVTPTGKKYHTHVCGSGDYTPTTLQEAINRGLTECAKCY